MTVQSVIDTFRRRYPSCDAARALELFNDVHRELCSRAQLRNKTEVITLTSGTQEYDYPAEVVKIHEAYHEESSDPGDWLSLVERSTDEYVVLRRNWRALGTTSRPTDYYVTSAASSNSSKAQIGLWPIPDTTTDGGTGYPRVRLYVSSLVDQIVGDIVSTQILNSNVYVYGMFAKWLMERQDSNQNDLLLYSNMAEKEMSANIAHIKDVQSNNEDTEFVPWFTLQQGRVI